MIKDLVASCRSYRRFYEEERIPYEELKDMDIPVYNIGDYRQRSQFPGIKV